MGPGGGCSDSNLVCLWVSSGSERSCENRLAASVGGPPERTVRRPVLRRPRARAPNWEHKTHCFAFH